MAFPAFSAGQFASINPHPWGVYRKKAANAICCFLHNQWLAAIDYAGTSLCRISSRHLQTGTNRESQPNQPELKKKINFAIFERFFIF